MKFRANLNGHEITGDVVNPGEWFGKAWVIEVGCGFSSAFYAVEADCESDAIDELCDSEEYGASIRIDEADADEDTHRAGNAGDPVDLDNVRIHGRGGYDHRMHPSSMPFTGVKGNSGLVYLMEDGTEWTPIQYVEALSD